EAVPDDPRVPIER
ncbi:hypothetical protein A2U01_0073434, partial [Trifolium medium]|nr:hypothetical protein [Trifolium medium]